MELKYLNTFKMILETGSFQKAAERLNYAQSTITLQMQILEQELSVKLFDKVGRRMELTQAGRERIPYIDAVLESVRQMENYGKSGRELTGTLSVSMPETLLAYRMQPVLRQFRENAPNIKLSLRTSNCYEIREQTINGSIDIGIHYDVGGYGASLKVEALGHYPLVLIGCPELENSECDYATKGQRKNACLLTVDKNSLYHKRFDGYMRERDIVLSGEVEISSIEAIKRSVASNLGVAFLPRFAVEEELAEGTLKELHIKMRDREIGVVSTYHKNKWMTPAMELFLRLLKAEAVQTSLRRQETPE